MRNSNTIKNQGLSLLTALFLFTVILTGCNKQVDITPVGSSQAVTMDEIKQWTTSFIPKMQDQPSFLYELAQKTTVKGESYIRVPVLGSKGESFGFFYFTKTAEAKFQSLYIITDQKDKSKLDGVVGFVDFDNKTYTVATYQDNKLVGLYEMKDTRSFFAGAFATGNSGTIRQKINDACPEATSIVRLADGRDSVVIKTNGTGIGCPSAGGETGGFWAAIWKGITDFLNAIGTFFDTIFGGSGSGYTGGYTGGGAFGIGGYSGWGFGGFISGGYGVGYSGGGGGYIDPVTGGTGPYDPFRGAWEPYDPTINENLVYDDTSLDYYEGDENDNNSDYTGSGLLIPSSITLANGNVVQIKFAISQSDGKSANQLVSPRVLECLIFALNDLSNVAYIGSLEINCTTNGKHSTTNSNHYRGLAVDIDIINGAPVNKKLQISGLLQISLDKYPNIRENYGPFFKHKLKLPWPTAPDHNGHNHFSVNGN
ncbi:MAG: hypothetical protein Q8K66_06445 [Sediminibacterium sp.]|nr:hypothetical protein [Sediminibacterium sp.]MDP3128226.1 hypothetical protein [Sediminibacterium sp.]